VPGRPSVQASPVDIDGPKYDWDKFLEVVDAAEPCPFVNNLDSFSFTTAVSRNLDGTTELVPLTVASTQLPGASFSMPAVRYVSDSSPVAFHNWAHLWPRVFKLFIICLCFISLFSYVDCTSCGTETVNAYNAVSQSANVILVCAAGTSAAPTAHLYQFPSSYTGPVVVSMSHFYAATPTTNSAYLQIYYSASSTCASITVAPINAFYVGSDLGGTNTVTFWYTGSNAYYLCFEFVNGDSVTVDVSIMAVVQAPVVALVDNTNTLISQSNPLSINLQEIIAQPAQGTGGILNWANINGQLIANVPNVVVTQDIASGTPTTPSSNIYNTGPLGPTTNVYYINPLLGFGGGGLSNVSFPSTDTAPGLAVLPVQSMVGAIYGNVLPNSAFFHWCTNSSGLFNSGPLFVAPNGTCLFDVAVVVTSSTTASRSISVGGLAINNVSLAFTSVAGAGSSPVSVSYNDVCDGGYNYVFLNTTMGDGQTCVSIDLAHSDNGGSNNVAFTGLGAVPTSGCFFGGNVCTYAINSNPAPTLFSTIADGVTSSVDYYVACAGTSNGGVEMNFVYSTPTIATTVFGTAVQSQLGSSVGPFRYTIEAVGATQLGCQFGTNPSALTYCYCTIVLGADIGGFTPYYVTSYEGGPPQSWFYAQTDSSESVDLAFNDKLKRRFRK
jgi:hypothetical protein